MHHGAIALLLTLAAAGATLADSPLPKYDPDVSRWPVMERPTEEWWQNNRSWECISWEVTSTPDGVRATAITPFEDRRTGPAASLPFDATLSRMGATYHPTTLLKVPTGWLVGYSFGEFGGALWSFSDDGRHRYRFVFEEVHANQLLQVGKQIYLIDGLDHRATSIGSIREVTYRSGLWRAKTLNTLPFGCYCAAALPDGRLAVAGYQGLLAVSLRGAMRTDILATGTDWPNVHPRSIAIDANTHHIYVGGAQFVVRYPLEDPSRGYELLIPDPIFLKPLGR